MMTMGYENTQISVTSVRYMKDKHLHLTDDLTEPYTFKNRLC